MLEIHERHDTNGYTAIVSQITSGTVHIVESLDKGAVNGYGVYTVDLLGEAQEIVIYDYSGEEWDIIDGVIRTILFKGMLGGINKCDFRISDNDKMAKLTKLGFITADRLSIDDINDFMSGCKSCGKK